MFCHCHLSSSATVGLVLSGKISDVPLACSVCRVLLQHLSNFSSHSASRALPCRSIHKSGKGRCCAGFLYYVVSLRVHGSHWSNGLHWRKLSERSLDNCLYLSHLKARKNSLCISACNLMAKLQMLSVKLLLCTTLSQGILSLFCPDYPNWLYFFITDADRVIIMDLSGVGQQLGLWLRAAWNGNNSWCWPVLVCKTINLVICWRRSLCTAVIKQLVN